jgi:hypothetical protein
MDDCDLVATCRVRTVLGIKPFCTSHGAWVRMIEAEWDAAEREYYEQ